MRQRLRMLVVDYVDEAGFTSYLYRQYARSLKGEKVHESIRGNKYERTSIVAGQLGQEIIAPLQYSNPTRRSNNFR